MIDKMYFIRYFTSLRIVIAVTLVITVMLAGACGSPHSALRADAVTDGDGLASIIVDGESVRVSVMDSTVDGQALAEINLYSGMQQNIQLLYIEDSSGKFFPSIQSVVSRESDGPVTIYLAPAGARSWTLGQPVAINIDIDELKKIADCPYVDLGYHLRDKYPNVRSIVFLYDDKVADITECQVSLYATPFPQVVYALLREEGQISGTHFMPTVYARSTIWSAIPLFFTSGIQGNTLIIGIVWVANILQEMPSPDHAVMVSAFDRRITGSGPGVTWAVNAALAEVEQYDLPDITAVLPPGANTTATPGQSTPTPEQGSSTPVPGTSTDTTTSGDNTNTSGGTSDGIPSTGGSANPDDPTTITDANNSIATDNTNDTTTGDTDNTTGSSADTTETSDTPAQEETAGSASTAQDTTPPDNAPLPETQSTTSTPSTEATGVHVVDSKTDTWGYGDYTVTTNIVSYSDGTCTRTSYYDNGQIAEQYTSVWNGYNGPMLVGSPGWTIDGVQRAWYPNGHIADEKYIEDGKLNGTWTQWNEDGTKAREENYKDGKLNGIRTLYWSNGNKRSELLWSNGEIVPESIVYWDSYNNAEPYKMVEFENGQELKITMDEYWQGSREIKQGPKEERGFLVQDTIIYKWSPVDYGTGRDGAQSTISPSDMPTKETSISTEGGGSGGGGHGGG